MVISDSWLTLQYGRLKAPDNEFQAQKPQISANDKLFQRLSREKLTPRNSSQCSEDFSVAEQKGRYRLHR